MNFSINSLSLSRIIGESPLLSSFNSQLKLLSLKNSHFNQFSSNFARLSMSTGKAIFVSTRFNNFLSSPLRFNQAKIEKTYIYEHRTIQTSEGPSVELSQVHFENCSNSDAGGGLLVKGLSFNLTIEKSSFVHCDSTGSKGGAFQFDGDSLFLYHSCFSYCEAETYGQAFHAESGVDHQLIIEGCDVSYSTTRVSESGEESAPVELYRGLHRIIESNISNCVVTMLYSAFHTDDSTSSYITGNIFQNNTGNIVVGAEDVKENDEIYLCSFVDNKEIDSNYGVIYVTLDTTAGECIFSNNNFNYLVQADVSAQFTFRECIFDGSFSTQNVTGVIVTYDDCEAKSSGLKPLVMSQFDTRYCWQIDPPTLPAGDVTYWFFIVFAVFAGVVGYTTFASYKRLNNAANINPNPLVSSQTDTYN